MASQVGNGKSFEWAVAKTLSQTLSIPIRQDSAATAAESKFAAAPHNLQRRHVRAAELSVAHILLKERETITLGQPKLILISSDRVGQTGDVRDVIVRGNFDLLGISCKNNHRAFKHSRLSATIDFVKKWGLDSGGVSEKYKLATNSVFKKLEDLRDDSGGKAEWKGVPNKQNQIYDPLLSAFENELERVVASKPSLESAICRSFINYIVGGQDFYKVICEKDGVEILGFNFHGTLKVQKSKYPTQIHSIERDTKKLSTTILRFQEGHTFAFRLHNAATLIEPSLKFDIQALSLPGSQIYTNHISL